MNMKLRLHLPLVVVPAPVDGTRTPMYYSGAGPRQDHNILQEPVLCLTSEGVGTSPTM